MEFSNLNINMSPVDSMVVLVPPASSSLSPDPVVSLAPGSPKVAPISPEAPPYNLRSLANHSGKENVYGGLDPNYVPIGSRKLRSRKYNLYKAQLKAKIDVVDHKQKLLFGVLRVTMPPSDVLK